MEKTKALLFNVFMQAVASTLIGSEFGWSVGLATFIILLTLPNMVGQ